VPHRIDDGDDYDNDNDNDNDSDSDPGSACDADNHVSSVWLAAASPRDQPQAPVQ